MEVYTMEIRNCASHAMKTKYIVLDTDKMENPIQYLNSVYQKYNRKLRLLGRNFTELEAYAKQLENDEWMVAFFGPFSHSKFYDPDDYSFNSMLIPDTQYHFILRENDGHWTQMDYNTFPEVADIEAEVLTFEVSGYKPYFFAVS